MSQSNASSIIAEDHTIRIVPAGPELCPAEFCDLAPMLRDLARQHDADHVVLDLTHVQFIDSACLSRLIRLSRLASELDAELELIHCRPCIAELMHLTRLDKMFSVSTNVAA